MLSDDINNLKLSVSNVNTRVDEILRAIKDIGEISKLQAENSALRARLADQSREIDRLAETIKDRDELLSGLNASFAMVTQGLYDQDNIEFAAIKTYRGWKYLIHNGMQTTNFDNVKSISIYWDKGEYVTVDMTTGEMK